MSASEQVGLAASVKNREAEFPYLARSLSNASPAHSTKVEWLLDWNGERPVWFNWTQIIRNAFGTTRTAMVGQTDADEWESLRAKYLTEHLRDVEKTIHYGNLIRQINYHFDEDTGEWFPIETRCMGGARFYLRGEPTPNDRIELAILRDTVFRELTEGEDGRSGEYLSEISLRVWPAKQARPEAATS